MLGGVTGDVEVRTLRIQTEHKVLWPDDGLEDAKILVGRLTLDGWIVETPKSIHDALLVLVRWSVKPRSTDYSMHSTFLTVSTGSVLFSRSNLLKRKDLCFSCLRLRHRRILRSSHLSSQVLPRFCRVTQERICSPPGAKSW